MPQKLTQIFWWCIAVVTLAACVEHSKDELQHTEINIKAEEALNYLNDLVEEDPQNSEIYYQLARVYFEKGHDQIALEQVKKGIELKRDNAEYYYLEGKIHQKRNQPGKAIIALKKAEALGKHNRELYKLMAEEYLKLKEPGKAREAINKLTNIDNSAEAYALTGAVMLALGDTAQALTHYQRSVKTDTTLAKAHQALADIYVARGNEEQAEVHINKLLESEPENLKFLTLKGNLLQRTGSLDSAKQIFQWIASRRSDYMDFYKLSNIYYLMRQYDSARYMAEKASEKNTDFLLAQLIIARSLDKERKYQDAIETYQRIIEADSTFNLAVTELDNLQRKVAYLWRQEQQRRVRDTSQNEPPPAVKKKEIDDN